MKELKPKKCSTKTFSDKMTFDESRDKALDITELEKVEVLFDYDPDRKDVKHIWQFLVGDCGGVNVTKTRKGLLGQFHTHYLAGRTTESCAFSGMDIVNGLGKENTIGCFFGNRNVKYRREYKSIDLRFKNLLDDKLDDLMRYTVNRIDHQFHTEMDVELGKVYQLAQKIAEDKEAEEKCLDYIESIEIFIWDEGKKYEHKATELDGMYFELGNKIMTHDGGVLQKK